LAHLGVDGSALGIEVAQAVPEIDVIIDGHSHTLLEGGQRVGDVLLAQAGAHAQYVGRVDITVSNGEVVSAVASVISQEYALENFTPRADITAAIERMNAELGEVLDEVVGYSPVTFYGDSPEHRAALRSSEVPIGNLVADAMRVGTFADLAMTNSGGIRAHLYEGEVTKGDIIEVLAFFNYAVVVQVNSAQLWEALENGVSNMPGNGRFPQISGFSFVFSFDEETDENGTITSVSVDG
jgi:2',3'-cyclic-nucleotide 2'-phosphodiesterase (5'-nucleotidase family)